MGESQTRPSPSIRELGAKTTAGTTTSRLCSEEMTAAWGKPLLRSPVPAARPLLTDTGQLRLSRPMAMGKENCHSHRLRVRDETLVPQEVYIRGGKMAFPSYHTVIMQKGRNLSVVRLTISTKSNSVCYLPAVYPHWPDTPEWSPTGHRASWAEILCSPGFVSYPQHFPTSLLG